MSIDLSQFHQVFFEESFEGLDTMESALLELNTEEPDDELINIIFRAAHSIKGGSATFGFTIIADFTHSLETLLDQIRDGNREIIQEHVDLLLQSVDCLREILRSYQSSKVPDTSMAELLSKDYDSILHQNENEDVSSADQTDDDAVTKTEKVFLKSCFIYFEPGHDILQTGNEPFRMFKLLAELGKITISTDFTGLPEFENLNLEQCYLSWTMYLDIDVSDVKLSCIEEIFEWVVDESNIIIDPVYDKALEAETSKRFFEKVGSDDKYFNNMSFSSSAVASNDDSNSAADNEYTATQNDPSSMASNVEPIRNENSEAEAASAAAQKNTQAKPETGSIRVGIDKIDNLINMVGELVITQSMLGQLGKNLTSENIDGLREGLGQLEHNTRELQESVMRIRMLPISFIFSRFPRMVRDMSRKLDKQINLQLIGETTELDKTVMEKIGDPLVHLVRNSIDHGIELPEDRSAAGKPVEGIVTLNAYHQSGNVVIEISDDGAGLNKDKIYQKAVKNGLILDGDRLSDDQVFDLIFQPGFSTAETVSELSGRGVGMDVVRRNISELNGTIGVKSDVGRSCKFTITLPLTLAILDGQLVRVGEQTYILPLVSIVESLQIKKDLVNSVAGGCDVFRLRNEFIPIIRSYEIFDVKADSCELENSLLVVVEGENEHAGLVVDDLLGQQQVVIKSLEANYERVQGISGATILGDGTVALILDIPTIIKMGGVEQAKKGIKTLNDLETNQAVA